MTTETFDAIQDKEAFKRSKDKWTDDGTFYVVDGYKYGITPDGLTVCCGLAIPPETPPDGGETPPALKKGVTKLADRGEQGVETIQVEEEGLLLHGQNGKKMGRPRKEEGESVSRMTEWRRQKEEQGVLL